MQPTHDKTLRTGVVGASGYSGELLVDLLARHPRAELAALTSRSLAGQPAEEVFPGLRGRLPGLAFTASEPDALAAREDVALWFLALPHGVAADYARALLGAGRRVIDLSADFRLADPARYEEFYGAPHPAPDLLRDAAYVIPEIRPAGDDAWKGARLIACPGCYPTSIITPLVPLLRAGLVEPGGIVANAVSGVSGAGKRSEEFYSFCERDGSTRAYGLPKHRHLSEMEEQLSAAAGCAVVLQFCPHLAPMKRGIAATVTARAAGGAGLEAVYQAWEDAFGESVFARPLPSGTYPDTAHVVGTNRVDFSAVYDGRTGNFLITSAEDNLMKGASGQAIQIMNLCFGFGETDGLL